MKKGSIKIKTKKSLNLRIHDIIEPLPDFVARPANRPSVPSDCNFGQLLSRILQIIKKNNDAFCIISELNLQKNGKFLFPEDFHTAPNCN